MKDYYRTLELNFGASIPEIKKAYRRLALKYHPDKNKALDAAQRFIEITEAYEVLCDDQKKSDYDYLYKKYFFRKEPVIQSEPSYQQKQQTWSDYGKQKAKEYSSMNFDDFSKRIFDEIKIGAGYLPNLIVILLVGGGIIGFLATSTDIFKKSEDGAGVFVFLTIVGLCVLVYYLYKVMAQDYAEERRRKFKNQTKK